MVRFSNSKLSSTQYIVTGITSIPGSTGTFIPQISTAYTVAHPVPPASRITSTKVGCGLDSTARDVVVIPDPEVDLALLYSNGYRYQYEDFRATTDCVYDAPDKVVIVQVKTESGISYIDETITSNIVITAYVGNRIVVPQTPSPNVVTNTAPVPSKLPLLTNNNNC
jgi:hypothetical protein